MMIDRRAMLGAFAASTLPLPLMAQRREMLEAPIVVEDGRLWIGAQIDGRALRFVVDTGAAGNFIEPEVARSLGLANVSTGGVVGGVGNRRSVVGRVEARNVVIGGVARQPRMLFSTYDFGRGLGGGDAAGLLAAGLVTAYDSDLVLGETMGMWRIWPSGRATPPAGTPLDSAAILRSGSERDESERIVVTATIDQKPYRLLVDTGAPRSLLLFSRATTRSGLWNAPRWSPDRLRGFGGASERLARITRATRLDFGPLVLNRPYVMLSDPASASFASDIDGILGLPLMTLFDWSIQPNPARVWLTRNARRPVAPRYNRSGLWLAREADGSARVEAVGAGSPAAAAGIAIGARFPDFAATLARINGPVGTEVRLGDQTVTLADYL